MPESYINKAKNFLAWTSREPFEKNCIELLSLVYDHLIDTRRFGLFEKEGIDAYTIESDSYKHAFQFKGFEQREFGKDQVKQCKKSIDSFIKGQIAFEQYTLVVNRPVKPSERKLVLEKLSEVPKSKCRKCDFLDINEFVSHLQKLYVNLSINKFKEYSSEIVSNYRLATGHTYYLKEVPYQMAADSTGLNPIDRITTLIIDEQTGKLKPHKWTFIKSEFGFGKTSLVQELISVLDSKKVLSIYLPVGTIPRAGFRSSSDFSKVVANKIYGDDLEDANEAIKKLIFYSVKKVMLTSSSTVLVLDGLDEHSSLLNIAKLQRLFNSFNDMVTPIIYTMRTEFWNERYQDFNEIIIRNAKHINYIELLDWRDEQMLEYVRSVQEQNNSNKLASLFQTIKSGKYMSKYGDIPKRPLFLKMLVEDIESDEDLNNIANLYENYFIRKLKRDIVGSVSPIKRSVNIKGGLLTRAKKIMDLLEEVASLMQTPVNSKELVLEDEINEEMLDNLVKKYGFEDILSLLLHSVLMPSGIKTLYGFKLKFAHKSYQEFFLARHFTRVYNMSIHEVGLLTKYPSSVKQFMIGFIELKNKT